MKCEQCGHRPICNIKHDQHANKEASEIFDLCIGYPLVSEEIMNFNWFKVQNYSWQPNDILDSG
jgi:hypothetical protein